MSARQTLIETDKYLRGEITEIKRTYKQNTITVYKDSDYDVVRVHNNTTTVSYPCGSDELYEVVKTVLIHIDSEGL